MKITHVEVFVLSSGLYNNPLGAEEPHRPGYMGLVKVSTSQGPLSRALVKEPLRLADGYLDVPSGAGLGVEVDESAVEKYRVA